jgi:hypothetical protein
VDNLWEKDIGKNAGQGVPSGSPLAKFNEWRNPPQPGDPNYVPPELKPAVPLPSKPIGEPPAQPQPQPQPPAGKKKSPEVKITNPDGSQTIHRAAPTPEEGEGTPQTPEQRKKVLEDWNKKKGADKTWMEKTGEGLSELSKSLEGVKAPARPPAPNVNVGAVAPRGPISVNHPQLSNLLALVGQNPSAAQGLLQRLTGLRGF